MSGDVPQNAHAGKRGQSGRSAGRPGNERTATIAAPMRRRLAGFARTLRDNGFKVGLAETGDALAILTSPAAVQPGSLKPALRALFCATHSDWERFDEIFDAFWRGEGMRARQILSGAPGANKAAARKLAEAHVPRGRGRSSRSGPAPRRSRWRGCRRRPRPPRGRVARGIPCRNRPAPHRRSR